MNDSLLLLEKAERSLEVARDLLRKGHSDFAASRTYYGYFYTAQALLLSKNLEFSSHSQVIAPYGFHYSRNQTLAPEYHRLLIDAFGLRNLGDYQTEILVEAEEVDRLIEGGLRFLEAASSYLGRLPEGGESGEA